MLLPWPHHSPFCSLCSGTVVHLLFLGYVSLIGTCFHCRYSVTQSCLTLCNPMDYSPPGPPWNLSVKNTGVDCHFLLQGGSSHPKDQTSISYINRFWFLYHCATWEAPILHLILAKRLRSDLHLFCAAAAAAAKSIQSCPTLCDPIDGSPSGSPVPHQARTLEWVAISFSNAWKWKVKVKLLSRSRLSNPMDWSLPGSSIHGIFQARVLEWGAIAFSDTSSVINTYSPQGFTSILPFTWNCIFLVNTFKYCYTPASASFKSLLKILLPRAAII